MTLLSDYMAQVQELVHDVGAVDFTTARLISKINQARTRTALDLHCCRTFYQNLQFIPNQERYPITNCVAGTVLLSGGQNYINPLVSFAGGGGTGAAATATVQGGVVTGINQTSWGQGYSSNPVVNIIDGSGWATNWQIRQALAALTMPANAINLVYSAIIALPPGDPVFIQWNSGAPTLPGDGLYALIQATLTFSQASIAALYTSATFYPSAPSSVPPTAAKGQTSAVAVGQTAVATISVTNQQFRLALANSNYNLMGAVYSSISSNPADPANAIWNSGASTGPYDALAAVLINSLGFTQAQVNSFYTFAATQVNSIKTVTNQQLRLAIAALGLTGALTAALSSSPADPANIQWFSGAGSTNATSDALYNVIASVGSASAVYAAAKTYPSNAPGSGALATAVTLRNVIDWNQLTVNFQSWKPTMKWLPWAYFQAWCRIYQSFPDGRPFIWTSFPENNYGMVFYIPDQTYGLELDAITLPDPLTSTTDVDTQILPPNDDCVQWYAAHLCYLYLQQYGPADYHEKRYLRRVWEINGSKRAVRRPNIYASSAGQICKWT